MFTVNYRKLKHGVVDRGVQLMTNVHTGVLQVNIFHFELARPGRYVVANGVLEHQVTSDSVSVIDDYWQRLVGYNAVPSDRCCGVRLAAKNC